MREDEFAVLVEKYLDRSISPAERMVLEREVQDDAIEASRLRFRPILMTSIAFILGVTPLAISTGAGANSRHAIGTDVMGGMVGATLLGVLFVPVFFVVMRRLLGDRTDGHELHERETTARDETGG